MSPRDSIDHRIGECIRRRRVALRVTQQELALALGCSYQQVQKFENGTNRIAAAQLQRAAERLGVPVATLFGEEPQGETSPAPARPGTADAGALARSFAHIRSLPVQRAVAALIQAIEERQGAAD